MLKRFEEGRKLVETCRTDLEAIRLKIEKVTQAGAVEPVPVVTNAAGENDIGI